MKKILLPINFSKNSDDVTFFALDAFNDEPCVFYFLHTYNYHLNGLDALCLLHDSSAFFEAEDICFLNEMIKNVTQFTCNSKYAKHEFKLLSKSSELIPAIQEAVDVFEMNIVLIGTQGTDLQTKKYIEQKVNNILNEVKGCPIMTVPLKELEQKEQAIEFVRIAS